MFVVRIHVGEPTQLSSARVADASPFAVYVLQNDRGQLYIGHTADLSRRVAQHAAGESRWTASRGPWELVHTESFPSRAEAARRERTLKSGRANQALRESLAGCPRGW